MLDTSGKFNLTAPIQRIEENAFEENLIIN